MSRLLGLADEFLPDRFAETWEKLLEEPSNLKTAGKSQSMIRPSLGGSARQRPRLAHAASAAMLVL